jgi:hypothetical protein
VTGDKAVTDNKALEAGVAIDGALTSCTAASARRSRSADLLPRVGPLVRYDRIDPRRRWREPAVQGRRVEFSPRLLNNGWTMTGAVLAPACIYGTSRPYAHSRPHRDRSAIPDLIAP